MAGRINEEDIATVRERARIDEIVGSYVTLRNAGGGSRKGLCPFHDEKTPSFQVTPARGFFYCFGCGAGGDVLTFLQKIDNLSFAEAVERLADRVGVSLRYTDDGGPRPEPGRRIRLMEAHQAATEFYVDQLTSPEAIIGRQFLTERGFDRASAERFDVGYAPSDGRALRRHLTGRGFSDAELAGGGLVRESGWDYFQGRLLWPIRDSGRQVVGFGARRLRDDDRMPAKYINTPETALYKKSSVLYGLDLARQQIGRKSQAVVVEGYTDVMAAHLAGVDTAVASCGTAFGEDHARLLRRLMIDHSALPTEIIFCFDGDAAGLAAAQRVFALESSFVGQTYVAVEPTGLDPCDLRRQHGDAAVRELIGRRVPLPRFVMAKVSERHDLDRADGRLAALREAVPMIAGIRDDARAGGYARELAGMLGIDPEEVRREMQRAASRNRQRTAPEPEPEPEREREPSPLPDPHDRQLATERETSKLLIQTPQLFEPTWDGLTGQDFTHPAYAAVFACADKAAHEGLSSSAGGSWVHQVSAAAENDTIRSLVAALAVEPLALTGPADSRYVVANSAKLQLLTAMRALSQLKSKLQRTNPVEHANRYNQMFSEFVVLEARRKQLHARSIGADD